jgi:hypothetical protein
MKTFWKGAAFMLVALVCMGAVYRQISALTDLVQIGSNLTYDTTTSPPTLSSSGSGGGGATNGIQQLNGTGTNTTFKGINGRGTNNFMITQSLTNVVTNLFVLDYIWTDQPVIAVFNGRMLTGAVDIAVNSLNATSSVTAQSLVVSNNASVSNLAALGVTVSNTLNASNVFALTLSVTNNATISTLTVTNTANVSNLTASATVTAASFAGAATNTLVDTNTFRQSTNLVTFNQYTNALTNGSGLFTLDFSNAAADNVFFAPSENFTLHLTNLPQSLPGGKSIALELRGTNVNVTLTMPATLTNRYGGVHAATYIIPANQRPRMGFTFPGNSNNATTFTNGSYYWLTNAP